MVTAFGKIRKIHAQIDYKNIKNRDISKNQKGERTSAEIQYMCI